MSRRGDTHRVIVPEDRSADDVVAAAEAAAVQLRRLVPDAASLEDVFLETMGTGRDGATAGGGLHADL